MTARRTKIGPPPTSQWWSRGWAVQWRRGNDHRDRYELVYQQQHLAWIYVTRAGWKWAEPNPRLASYRALAAPPVWSSDVYPTWQDAVTAYARHYRKRCQRRIGQIPAVPQTWLPMRREGRQVLTPWTPRPVHDTFDQLEAGDQS